MKLLFSFHLRQDAKTFVAGKVPDVAANGPTRDTYAAHLIKKGLNSPILTTFHLKNPGSERFWVLFLAASPQTGPTSDGATVFTDPPDYATHLRRVGS